MADANPGPRDASEAAIRAWAPADATGRPLRQWGNLIFPLPLGWEMRVDDGVAELRPEDWTDLDSYLEILILPGAERSGDVAGLRAWAAGQVRAYVQREEESHTAEMMAWRPTVTPAGKAVQLAAAAVRDDDGDLEDVLVMAAFQRGGRADVIVAIPSRTEDVAQHSRTFESFVATIESAAERGRPLVGAPVGGPLRGMYWGTRIAYGMNFDATMRMDVVHHMYVFWPDGRFSEDVPPEGINQFDAVALADTHGHMLGNYYVRGDAVILHYATGEVETLEIDGDVLVDGRARMHVTQLAPDGYALVGKRQWLYYSGFAAMEGGIGAGGTVAFRADGTFTNSRWSGASGSFDSGGGFAIGSDRDDVLGQYVVRGGRVFLTDPDGSRRSWPVHLSTDDETGEVDVWIGGEVLKR
ncbi:MAG: hypothetical protein AB8G96_01110 [Phycisphaerales bacterium]